MERRVFIALIPVLILTLWLNPVASWLPQRFLKLGAPPPPTDDIRRENSALRAEIAILQGVKQKLPAWQFDYIAALVYARYPFNLREQLLVNAGRDQGLQVGQAALLAENRPGAGGSQARGAVLLGKVDQVFDRTALITTLFDSHFQLAVRVGSGGTEALLTGGNEPRITLIPKEAKIERGASVYVADSHFPYGIAVGEVETLQPSRDQLFQEATIKLPYDLNQIWVVILVT